MVAVFPPPLPRLALEEERVKGEQLSGVLARQRSEVQRAGEASAAAAASHAQASIALEARRGLINRSLMQIISCAWFGY